MDGSVRDYGLLKSRVPRILLCLEFMVSCTAGLSVETACEGVERYSWLQSHCSYIGCGEVVHVGIGFDDGKIHRDRWSGVICMWREKWK